ncbi:DNA polymerase I-like protein with 3'-5' exonuclease and polymerase domains [Microvirga flocculans]|uniref:DNA polymerase I-like protein with 3'-5' exonuclease and polymerase domains n=1 Tax=Microvirga flocculans TaxID=217168 RepID=A0A7W6N763_9HYPH|nr:DNA polymerase [Microvirga flocculans]MBB4039135.1 DNA polymerase I-like protein with 3'-5' exonuclease and polymerase domains [Microvirga flocculans]
MQLFFDIEGNDLLEGVTKIWCICAVNIETGEEHSWRYDQIEEALDFLGDAELLVAHNGIRYDFPALKKVHGWDPQKPVRHDSLVLARLAYPNIKKTDKELVKDGFPGKLVGKDSLEAWGHRVGIHKADYQGGFDAWSQEMQDYCLQDCVTGAALYRYLKVHEMDQRAVTLEHRATEVCFAMEMAGWPFDEKAAGELYTKLTARKQELEEHLVKKFGSWQEVDRIFTPKRPNAKLGYTGTWVEEEYVEYTKEGDPIWKTRKVFKGDPVTKYKTVTFNPGSRKHIIKKLLEAGWKPDEYTDKGSPKLDEEVLENLDLPEAKDLIEFLLVQKRLGQLGDGKQAWLQHVKNGKIHASYNTMGTVTGRAAHYNPNIAQVPKGSKPYGKECRALFTVPKGWKLLGCDFEGLELRCLAHWMAAFDKGTYADTVVNGDVHWTHSIAMGLIEGERDKESLLHDTVRDNSKTITYADLYGCGPAKAGNIVFGLVNNLKNLKLTTAADELYRKFFGKATSVGPKQLENAGKKLKQSLLKYFPARKRLIEVVGSKAEKGFLKSLDGRHVPVRAKHSALNSLLQSTGAILCKRWLVDTHDNLIAAGYRWGWDGDFVILGWIHDELQIAVREGLEDVIGPIVVQSAKDTGPKYGFRCRLDSKYIVGNSWKETH